MLVLVASGRCQVTRGISQVARKQAQTPQSSKKKCAWGCKICHVLCLPQSPLTPRYLLCKSAICFIIAIHARVKTLVHECCMEMKTNPIVRYRNWGNSTYQYNIPSAYLMWHPFLFHPSQKECHHTIIRNNLALKYSFYP